MGIPESQLETWSHQGATNTAQATHDSIRYALTQYSFPDGVSYDVYLHGSYRNSTNIRGDSDVDLVVQLDSTFSFDISDLTAEEGERAGREIIPATYLWKAFRSDVLIALRNHYETQLVTEGHKSIKLAAGSGRLNADIVVCTQYRKYTSFPSYAQARFVEGMCFYALPEWRQIINYPKLHYDKGAKKSDETNQRFKPAVRMFKNARSYMVDKGMIDEDCAPSYFLECLVYNMPSDKFGFTLELTLLNLIMWYAEVWDNGSVATLMCQNGQSLLFGSQPEQWLASKATTYICKLADLWKNW